MVQDRMRTPHDRALKLAGAPSPSMRRRGYFDDGGGVGDAGGPGDGNPVPVPAPPVTPPPPVSASDDDDLTGKPNGLNTGTPYTGVPKPGAKPKTSMNRGGVSHRRGR